MGDGYYHGHGREYFKYQGKENGHDVWSEGSFYKVNLAVIVRGHDVILRNTYTGKEKLLSHASTKALAMKYARERVKEYRKAVVGEGDSRKELAENRKNLAKVV